MCYYMYKLLHVEAKSLSSLRIILIPLQCIIIIMDKFTDLKLFVACRKAKSVKVFKSTLSI